MKTSELFKSIKSSLNDTEQKTNTNRDRLSVAEIGKTYTVRLLPFCEDPSKTFFHYYTYGFTSKATGQYIGNPSPTSFGEPDPIAQLRFKLWNTGDKDEARLISRRENWLVNVYVVDDPTNPENNGTVKYLRYGKQIHKVIMDAIDGDDAEELGERVFDLTENGCNLKIKVEEQGGYPSYTASKFSMPAKIPGVTKSNIDDIYKMAFDLEKQVNFKSYDELQKALDEHFLLKVESRTESRNESTPTSVPEPDNDVDDTTDNIDDPEINALLEEINSPEAS